MKPDKRPDDDLADRPISKRSAIPVRHWIVRSSRMNDKRESHFALPPSSASRESARMHARTRMRAALAALHGMRVIQVYIEMGRQVCTHRTFDNARPGEGGRTPRAEHASPCSDVTRDATLIFWPSGLPRFSVRLSVPPSAFIARTRKTDRAPVSRSKRPIRRSTVGVDKRQ